MVISQLLSDIRSGSADAFKQLVSQYQDKVFSTAIGMVQDNGMAEDIAQEVFITVYKSMHTFNERSSLSTWIYRITVNKCLDHLRAKSRQKRGVFSRLFSTDDKESADIATFDHPGMQLERKENARYLFEAIQTLPDNQKTVFVLAHIEELPQKDIADIMNLSIKAIESLLQRAKANLRKKLSDVYDRRNKQ